MIASIADLVAFLKDFHQGWLTDASLDASLIPSDLPPGLAMIYRELGTLVEIEQGPENDWCAPFGTQDSLVPVSRLKRVDGMIEFAWENQGNWSARCSAGQVDPPVYSNAPDLWETPRRGFVVVCDSLNHFLATLCLQEAVMGCRNLAALHSDLPPDQLLRVPMRPLWLNGRYVVGEPDHHFFVSPNLDVIAMDSGGLWIGSPSQSIEGLVTEGIGVQVLH